MNIQIVVGRKTQNNVKYKPILNILGPYFEFRVIKISVNHPRV